MFSLQELHSKEDKLFLDKLEDMVASVEKNWTPRFTFFLDERQQAVAELALKSWGVAQYRLFGGSDTAQRKLLGIFPEYSQPQEEDFPLQAVALRFRPEDKPRHQDILGSLMGLQIKRELVGDILVGESLAVVFCLPQVFQVMQNELRKVGRIGVQLSVGAPEQLPQAVTLQPMSGTVSSMRLDCIVAFVTDLSREKAAALIKSGSVSINFFESDEASKPLMEGDVLSIRGFGRFVVTQVGGTTKKGRLRIVCSKYI